MKVCKIEGCENTDGYGRSVCSTHRNRMRRHGSYDAKFKPFELSGLPPTTINAMSDFDLAWVTGIIEGEGCFQAHRPKHAPKAYPHVIVGMTDRDIIDRLAAITGIGKIRTQKVRARMTKPLYKWSVCRSNDSVALIRAILPHLGARRTQQALAVLEECGFGV